MYFDGDKTYAYRLGDDDMSIERIIIDEYYAQSHPVWIINKSDVPVHDIVSLKSGDFGNTAYIPRIIPMTKTMGSDYVSRMRITSLKSITQHDDWLNGGSEYVLYWIFPAVFDTSAKAESNTYGQIKMSRKEIKNGAVRQINFLANDDWTEEQIWNKLKVIEFDPGKDIDIDIDLKGSYKGFTGEIKTKITINRTDELIMEYAVKRKARMTDDENVGNNTYRGKFEGSGVTLTSEFKAHTVSNPF